MPLHVSADALVFPTEQGSALDIRNFYQREWLPMLRRLGIRPRPFYNTRHTYISYAISLGMKLATVCAQTGTSPAMIEKHYGRYMPQAGDFDLIEAALGGGETSNRKSNIPTSWNRLSVRRCSILCRGPSHRAALTPRPPRLTPAHGPGSARRGCAPHCAGLDVVDGPMPRARNLLARHLALRDQRSVPRAARGEHRDQRPVGSAGARHDERRVRPVGLPGGRRG